MLELVASLAIMALLVAAYATRYGNGALQNEGADGFARTLAVDMLQARRRAISTGDNHYLQLATSGGSVTSYQLYRRASGGAAAVDQVRAVPAGVNVTTSSATLEFDFDGASLAAYTVTVAGPNRTWTVTTVMATGTVQTSASP